MRIPPHTAQAKKHSNTSSNGYVTEHVAHVHMSSFEGQLLWKKIWEICKSLSMEMQVFLCFGANFMVFHIVPILIKCRYSVAKFSYRRLTIQLIAFCKSKINLFFEWGRTSLINKSKISLCSHLYQTGPLKDIGEEIKQLTQIYLIDESAVLHFEEPPQA
ncbi:hypothetical protein HYC85_015085 [Camellia sinensis]|uniref:Uncharacterized protein n=1 Tax=Camellia sinensis TaxID=4442 RepID=A0A7J7HBC7_CAMSI|nr:hypothetical protein HYC85_015085 [Camellia sinensis]